MSARADNSTGCRTLRPPWWPQAQRNRPRLWWAVLALLNTLWLSASCTTGRVEALLVSGGHSPQKNVTAHLQHLTRFRHTLGLAGLAPEAITLFSSDGADPKPDRAEARAPWSDQAWWLQGTSLATLLKEPTRLSNSSVPKEHLLPARKAALETWFALRGARLQAGDTLLVYVTDHGHRRGREVENTQIDLWREGLSVAELRKLTDSIPQGVRIITVMSQCYSGAFAKALFPTKQASRPRPKTCGFFATLASRPSYGCYRELVDHPDGHAMRWLDAFKPGQSLAATHREVWLRDGTPDIPVTSSVLYLLDLLHRQAKARSLTPPKLAETLLPGTWPRDGEDAAAIHAITTRFGLTRVEQVSAIWPAERRLRWGLSAARRAENRAKKTLEGHTAKLLTRLEREEPRWGRRSLTALYQAFRGPNAKANAAPDVQRAFLRRRILEDLRRTQAQHPELLAKLTVAKTQWQASHDRRLRFAVRHAAMKRIETLAFAGGGRVLASQDPAQAEALQDLERCEAWPLPQGPQVPPPESAPAPSFPPLEDDFKLLRVPSRPKQSRRPRPGLKAGTPAMRLDSLLPYRGTLPKAGKARLLMFWATWCRPCKAALPELLALAKAHDLELVTITRDTPKQLDRLFATGAYPVPERVFIESPTSERVHASYAAQGLPTFVLVDAQGRIVVHQRGFRAANGLERIRQHLPTRRERKETGHAPK